MPFPTSIEAATYFLVAYNNLATTASQIIGISDTTVYVASTDNFPSIGWFTCEDEIRSYTGKTSGSFTGCTPGTDDTTAAEHAAGKAVSLTLPAVAHNRVVTELRAVMTALGAGFTLSNYATMGKNLLLNPDFTSYNIDTNLPDFWELAQTPTLAVATDTLFAGKGGNQITITGAGATFEGIKITGGAANRLKVLPSTKYTFSFDYKVTAGDFLNVALFSFAAGVQGTTHVSDSTLASTSAIRHTATFTTDADATNLQIFLRAKNDGDIVICSHVKLEEGAIATPYVPQDREITTKLTEASNATPGPAIWSNRTIHVITALAAAAEFAAPSGTAYDGDMLEFIITDDGTGRALTYNAIYVDKGIALPSTTTAGKELSILFQYNSADSKWGCKSSVEET